MRIEGELLLRSVSEGILMLSADGYIQYVNPAAASITGHVASELVDKPLSVIYSKADEGIRAEYELSLAARKGKFVVEGWRTKKDGSTFWGELTIASQKGEDGKVTGYTCVLRDTSERKKAEYELRQSEERYRLMVEGVREYSIFLLDPTGHIQTWNEGAERIKGYSANEIIGKHFSIFYTGEDLESKKPEREIKIAIESGKYEEEGWRVKKNGSVFWANIVLTALFNEQNKLIGFSKVTRDLTERKYSEESLRQSEERYRSLVEQVTDYGIFMLDQKGRIMSWNEGAKRMKGYQPEEIIGKYFSIFYPEEDILNGKPAHELKVARAEGKYEEEGWRLRKDGSTFWANVVITAVYNPEGSLIGYSKVTRDLTERKESERALRESHNRLRILADKLQVTNTELSYANEELGQFTSIVSHDLQEPIRTIKSFLQLIEMKLDEGQHENLKTYISKSINAAARMKELIQNLLHYAQLGQGDVVEKPVSVKDLIDEALQNLRMLVEKSGAQITIHSEVETVQGDPVQLVQLIQNLLSNALKFTESGNPVIEIRCQREEGGQVRISVKDNGIGIAEADLNKVFEIFRRLDTKKDFPGTGIGLAICKKIIDRHRGKIWPESEKGKGTTFHFTLAADKAQKLAVR